MFKGIIIPALKTTWRKKSLWLISVLTITPLTLINEWKLISNTLSGALDPFNHFIVLINTINNISPNGLSIATLGSTISAEPIAGLSFILSLVIVIVFLIFFTWIISNTQALIILNTSEKYNNTKLSLSNSLTITSQYWKKIFALNISLFIFRILIVTLLIIAGLGLLGTQLEIIFWLITLAALSTLMFFSFTLRIGILEIIFKNRTIFSAVQQSIKNVKKNFGKCLELSFVIFIITLITISLIIMILSLIISDEELSITIISVLLIKQGYLKLFGGILFLIATLLISGVVLLFEYATWVHWYELGDNRPKTLIKNIFARFKKT